MIIETDRLYMRRLTEGDFDALCKICRTRSVCTPTNTLFLMKK